MAAHPGHRWDTGIGVPSLCTVMSVRGSEGQVAICHTSCGCEWTSAIRSTSFSGSNSSTWICTFTRVSSYCLVHRQCFVADRDR